MGRDLHDIADVSLLIPQSSDSISLAWDELCHAPWAVGWLQEIPSITAALSLLTKGIGNQLESELFKNGSVRKESLPGYVRSLLNHREHRHRFEANRGLYSCRLLGDIVVSEVTKYAACSHKSRFGGVIDSDVFCRTVYRETSATQRSCPGGGLVACRSQHRHTAAVLYTGWNLNQLFGKHGVLHSEMMTDKTMLKCAERVEILLGILWLISNAPTASSSQSNDAAALLAIVGHVMIWISVWDVKCNPMLPRNSNFGL